MMMLGRGTLEIFWLQTLKLCDLPCAIAGKFATVRYRPRDCKHCRLPLLPD